jgi:hypothetical protein
LWLLLVTYSEGKTAMLNDAGDFEATLDNFHFRFYEWQQRQIKRAMRWKPAKPHNVKHCI